MSAAASPPPNDKRKSGGNAVTWLLLSLVVAAIGFVGWWAFFAPGVAQAPEVRVVGGGTVATSPAPPPREERTDAGAPSVTRPAPLAPSPADGAAPVAPESGGAPR